MISFFRFLYCQAICLLFPFYAFAAGQDKYSRELYSDGPYIFYDSIGNGARIVSVSPEGSLVEQRMESLPADRTVNVRSQDGQHSFDVHLHDVVRPASIYSEASKTYVISDPHGNFDCFYSILRAGNVIDSTYHWTFDDGHLVVIGDVMDRGVDATTIFWLIYKLEAEAKAAGGNVSFLLGNHEPLVLMNDNRYTEDKYLALADTLGIPCGQLYGPNTELGRWLITRNTMMRIGRDLFVHAGLSADLYNADLPMDTINAEINRGLYLTKAQRKDASERIAFLFATFGPIWYRGLVRDDAKNKPVTSDTLQLILDRYEADRLYVGHTIFPEVTQFYGGKVIGVNVDNAKARKNKRNRAVLIQNGQTILVNDEGQTLRL